MNDSDKISIIVPVFNVEKFLEKCIESIIKQTYQNIEIILIDDGSTDSSGQICDEWEKKDERIRVFHKENEGLGHARNTGLEKATGMYVMYIDSDDYISANMVERLFSVLLETNSDTVFCGLSRVCSNGSIVEIPGCYDSEVFLAEDIIDKVLLEMVGTLPSEKVDNVVFMSVWHAIYSTKIIEENEIRFPSERKLISEDIIYHIDYLQKSKRVAYIKDCLYFYRENPNSLSKKYDRNRFERQKVLYTEIIKRLSDFLPEEKYLYREQRIFLAGVRGRVVSITSTNQKNKLKEIHRVCRDDLVVEVIRQYPYHMNPIKHRIFNTAISHKWGAMLFILALFANKVR
ncbi:glycosyltransferase [Acetobacterium wieringae]|uniref:glycosyltransferase n=1 Tax=Acetobacterium wieringae TaxID=52694 RepID=UPI002033A1BF|nr:glycosyltransferase [Acetobacterium wieringae]URN84118.1 glycosyltransferase [Acetobacterium wieringae]